MEQTHDDESTSEETLTPSKSLRQTRILLVLDLNGLLVHREYKQEAPHPLPDGHVSVGRFYMWRRKGLDEFLNFLFDHFDVLVWSSAMRKNVELIIEKAFGEQRVKKLIDIFDQENCIAIKPHPDPKETRKPLFLKPLERVWKKHPQYNERNTLLVDDSHLKARENPPNTLFCPKAWSAYDDFDDAGLCKGGEVRDFLERLAQSNLSVAEFIVASKKGHDADGLSKSDKANDVEKEKKVETKKGEDEETEVAEDVKK